MEEITAENLERLHGVGNSKLNLETGRILLDQKETKGHSIQVQRHKDIKWDSAVKEVQSSWNLVCMTGEKCEAQRKDIVLQRN